MYKKALQGGIEPTTSCIAHMLTTHQTIMRYGKLMGCLTYYK